MIHAWGITDKGAVRTQNQDGFYLDVPSEHLAVGVVCDGMGGAKAGNIASLIAVETFVDALQGMQPDGDGEAGPAAVLSRAAETANTAVYHRAVTDPDCRGMGTTMVAALVVEQTAYLLNIGDSRAYHINEDGITRLTRDHSVVEDMVARGDITPEKELQPGDFLLLCSDGLSNIVTDLELLYEAIHGGEPSDCCQRLLHITLSRGAPDNVTAVLFQIV